MTKDKLKMVIIRVDLIQDLDNLISLAYIWVAYAWDSKIPSELGDYILKKINTNYSLYMEIDSLWISIIIFFPVSL